MLRQWTQKGEIFLGHTSSGFLVVHGFGPGFRWEEHLVFKCWLWIIKRKSTLMEMVCSGSKDLASSSTLLSAPIRWKLARGGISSKLALTSVFCGDGGRKSRVDQRDSENSGDSTSSPGEHQARWSRLSYIFFLHRITIWRCLWIRSGTIRLHFSTDDFNTKVDHCTGVYSPWNQELTISFSEFQ